MQSAAAVLLSSAHASSSKADGPCCYLDFTGLQPTLKQQQQTRARSAAAGSSQHDAGRLQHSAQTAGPIANGNSTEQGTEQATSSSSSGAEHAAQLCRRPRWDACVNLPTDPAFPEALANWQRDVDRGVFAPKLLGSISTVSSGRVQTTVRPRCQAGSSAKSPLGRPAAAWAHACSHTTTAITTTSSSSSTAAAAGTAGTRASRGPSNDSSTAAAAAAVTPAVFQGSGENALQALEGIVLRHLVAKPHLTPMQLQQAVQAISRLDSPCQLAAIGILVRAGFWLAAMQIAYADGLIVLSDVLLEMRATIELGLHWNSLILAVSAWRWAQVDRDLFLHTFRTSGLTLQYLALRKQLTWLQQLQAAGRQQQQHLQGRSPLAVQHGAASGSSSSAPRAGCHPDLARAEQVLLVSIIDSYLEHLAAAAADSTAASTTAAGSLSSRLVGCYAGFESDAAAVIQAGKQSKHQKQKQQGSNSNSLLTQSCSTLHISKDWRIQLEAEEQVRISSDADSDSSSSSSSSSSNRSSDSSDRGSEHQPGSGEEGGGTCVHELQGNAGSSSSSRNGAALESVAAAAAAACGVGEAAASTSQPDAQPPADSRPDAAGLHTDHQQPQEEVPAPAPAPPPPPPQPCSRPQSHQTSRRCSTATGLRPGTAHHSVGLTASSHHQPPQQQQQQQQQQQWPPAVGSILAFPGTGRQYSHSSSAGHSCTRSASSGASGSLADGLVLSLTAAGALRPASAATGLSKVSRPGSSSVETRPRPGSAATQEGSAPGTSGSLLQQQQQRLVLGGIRGSSALEAVAGSDDPAGLVRFKESCAQHRQDLQEWAEETAASTECAPAVRCETDSNVAAGRSRLSQAGSSTAADRSRPTSAAAGASAATPLSPAPAGRVSGGGIAAVVAAATSRLSSDSASSCAAAASTAGSPRGCSMSSDGGDLLLSSSKGLLSPHESQQASAQAGSSCRASGDSAGAAVAGAHQEGTSSCGSGSAAHGRVSPVPPLPLREAGLIVPDDSQACAGSEAKAPALHAASSAGGIAGLGLKALGKAKAASKKTAAAAGAAGNHGATAKSAKPRAAKPAVAAGTQAAVTPSGQSSAPSSTAKPQAGKKGAAQQQEQQQQQQQQHAPIKAAPVSVMPAQAAALDSKPMPAQHATAHAAAVSTGCHPAATTAATAAAGTAQAGACHLPDGTAAGVATAVQDTSSSFVTDALSNSGQPSAGAQTTDTAACASLGLLKQRDVMQPAAMTAAQQPADKVTEPPTAVAAAAAGPPSMLHEASPAGTSKASSPTGQAGAADSPAAASQAEYQLIVELTQTMEAFRQHLVQTTLMAQQLLAQQVEGQAAREAAGPGSSNSISRPSSAAAVRRLSQQTNSSGGNRPGSSGQPRRLPAAGSAAAGAQGLSGVPGSAVSPGHPQHEGLVQLQGVLEAEEPPTAEEVQAYARYLGMDPSQDAALLYLAEEALLAPVPPGWTVHLDAAQNEFFHNTASGESAYEHPLDQHYRQLYREKAAR